MKKMLRFVLLVLVVLGVAAGVGMWKVRQLADSALLIKDETIFTLKPGTGRLALGDQLYAEKVLNRPRVFQWLLRLEPELSHFKAGTYRITPQMTVREMLQLMASGKEAQFPLRFVEGMRLSDYLKQLRESPYIKHTLSDDTYATVAQALKLFDDFGVRTTNWSPRSIKSGTGEQIIGRTTIKTRSLPWRRLSKKRRR